MSTYLCKRCGIDFSEKRILLKHLNRVNPCIPIELDISVKELLDEINKKDGIICINCKKIYKTEKTLKHHKCASKKINPEIEELKKELKKQLRETKEVKETLKKLLDKPINTTNIHNNNTINNNLNVTLNCFMDTSGKPVEYLLNSENLKEKILNWMKSKKGLFKYIDEKFYNPEHPENMLIKRGDNGETIKLHISGKWKQMENMKASDLILTNVGNDFMLYMDTMKENEEEYKENIKILKKFENEIMKPLEWGLEISEDNENLITKTIVKNKDGEYVYLEEEIEKDKKLELTNDVIIHIHSKDLINL